MTANATPHPTALDTAHPRSAWRAGLGALLALCRPGPRRQARNAAPTRAALEAALAEQQQKGAELARINLRQLELIGVQAGRFDALAAAHASAIGRCRQLEAELGAARRDIARERHASELLGSALGKAKLRLEAMPHLEADLNALWARLERPQAAPAGTAQRHSQ